MVVRLRLFNLRVSRFPQISIAAFYLEMTKRLLSTHMKHLIGWWIRTKTIIMVVDWEQYGYGGGRGGG